MGMMARCPQTFGKLYANSQAEDNHVSVSSFVE